MSFGERIKFRRGELKLSRGELAEHFKCVPSQINYVLTTRFTPEHGYTVDSRRGGGGYIRIVRVQAMAQDHLSYLLRERIGESLDAQSAQVLCAQLAERRVVSPEEARLMAAAVWNMEGHARTKSKRPWVAWLSVMGCLPGGCVCTRPD